MQSKRNRQCVKMFMPRRPMTLMEGYILQWMDKAQTKTKTKNGDEPTSVHHLHCEAIVGCLTSQQHASVSQGRISSDKFTCCHTETEVADQTFYLTPSQYIDTGPTGPSADPLAPGAWQGSRWTAVVVVVVIIIIIIITRTL